MGAERRGVKSRTIRARVLMQGVVGGLCKMAKAGAKDRVPAITAHNWRHADRPPKSTEVDIQLRIDNSMAPVVPGVIEIPLAVTVDNNPYLPVQPTLVRTSVDAVPIDVETPDHVAQSDTCDEICAEMLYLQWKLRKTMKESQRQTRPLLETYKKIHHAEIVHRGRDNRQRQGIEALRQQIIAEQQERRRKKMEAEAAAHRKKMEAEAAAHRKKMEAEAAAREKIEQVRSGFLGSL